MRDARRELKDSRIDRTLLDIWLREQNRTFAIETGQIEGLYLLRRSVTEQFITERFGSVREAHSVRSDLGEPDDRTLRGLLKDRMDGADEAAPPS